MATIRPMSRFRNGARGGAVLDVIVGFGVILLAAFVLQAAGLSFHQILHGAERFFSA